MTTLLIIDAQVDFHPGGSLAIPTANDDSTRIADLIKNHPNKIGRVVATMDSHLKLHIAHPGFWYDKDGNHPGIFTLISHQDVVDGKWKPRTDIVIKDVLLDPTVFEGFDAVRNDDGSIDLEKYALEYTRRLEDNTAKKHTQFKLCIWPEHCLIGSPGHVLVENIRKALDDWSETTGGSIEFVMKGENLLTESYSAMEAEVPVDKSTQFDRSLFDSLASSEKLIVCGQAMSHCVNFTVRNLMEHWPKDKYSNVTLLTDCASSVPGFEGAGDQFQKDMKEMGVVLQTSDQVFS